ncbi:MAG: protein tyrosine phosphatase family protein [Shewanella sp.]
MKSVALRSVITALLLSAPLAHAAIEQADKLTEIKALQQHGGQLLSAGLPSAAQFTELKQAGVDVVINLMPDSNQGAHQDEAQLVRQAGMEYVYIPVDWQNPTLADVDAFFKAMEQHASKDVLVHCMLNYRASAFTYLYQLKQGQKANMAETMAPWGDELASYPKWQALLTEARAHYGF